MRLFLVAVLALLRVLPADGTFGALSRKDDPPVVPTTSGRVGGKEIDTPRGKCDVYLGIPFAAPPVGDLRFQVSALTRIHERYIHSALLLEASAQSRMDWRS